MIKRLKNGGKIYVLFFGLLFCMIPSESYAQKISLNFKDVPLKTVLNKISELSDFKFVYTSNLEIDKITVSISENGKEAKDVIEDLLKRANIQYKFKGKQVVLTSVVKNDQKIQEFSGTGLLAKQGSQQKITVKGVVIDASTGQVLPGVYIKIKDKKTFQVSDFNGYYSIAADPGDVLVCSFIGMEEQSIPVNNRTLVNISMEPDMIKLNDVIVTGYQTLSKERSTGSYSTITSESIDNKLQPSFRSMLEGMSAGVTVSTSGNIVIRGLSSISGVKTPLIVVDGYPLIGNGIDLESVNPDNVENITILKDAVAASIYGARASNGVIVITTKKAQSGKFTASYKGTYGVTQKLRFSTLNRASVSDYIDAEIDLYNANPTTYSNSYNNWNKLTEVQYLLLAKDKSWMSEAEVNSKIEQLRKNDAMKEIEKYMLRPESSQQHSINITGGTEKNLFNGSLKLNKEYGNLDNNSNSRFIADVNNIWKPAKWFSFKFISNINYTKSISSGENFYGFRIDPYTDLYTDSGEAIFYNPTAQRRIPEYDKYSLMKSMLYHPSEELNLQYSTNQNLQIRLGGDVTLKISDELSLSGGGSWIKGMDDTKTVKLGDSYLMRSAYNDGASRTNSVKRYIPDGGKLDGSKGSLETWVIRGQINFNKTLDNNKHRITAMLGSEISKDTYETMSLPTYLGYNPTSASINTGFDPYEYNKNTNNIKGDMLFQKAPANLGSVSYGGTIGIRDNRFVGWYANGSYELMDKYILSGSVRLDLTNFFGTDPKYRYKPTWSIGGTYKISDEEFFKPLKHIVNRLHLRGSYGVNGNISLNDYPYLVLSVGSYNMNTNGISYGISNFPNNQLRWERTNILNLGADISLLKDRVRLNAEYYSKNSTDLISSDIIDYTRGTYSLYQNVGSVLNRGFELSVSGDVIKSKTFNWSSEFILSKNKSKLLTYNGNLTNILNYTTTSGSLVKNYPMYGIWGIRYAGLDGSGTPLYYNSAGEKISSGNLKPTDAKYIGSSTPTCELALKNDLSYRNFNLSIMFIAKLGGHFRTDLFNGSSIDNRHVGERWKNPGDENYTIYPKLVSGSVEQYYLPYADTFVSSSNLLKLRDITLSYDIPSNITKKAGLSGVKLYTQGRNLFYITAKGVDVDPEGINARPQVFFGISVNL
ncbi:MAG: SusC/RagA family TonB-linked outer membrane protein [Bacteroidales bacterium]|nr:SusC/RagA family TonB-linked outer membrane protein [Bacteroidales bacterium]